MLGRLFGLDFLLHLKVCFCPHSLLFLQHVCPVHSVKAACSAAAVHRKLPATTSLESAAVLLDLPATAVKRVSPAAVICVT